MHAIVFARTWCLRYMHVPFTHTCYSQFVHLFLHVPSTHKACMPFFWHVPGAWIRCIPFTRTCQVLLSIICACHSFGTYLVHGIGAFLLHIHVTLNSCICFCTYLVLTRHACHSFGTYLVHGIGASLYTYLPSVALNNLCMPFFCHVPGA